MKSINNINQLNKSDFLSIFGNVFEKTEWISEKVFELKPFKDFNDLSSKLLDLYENCHKEKILIIFNSHPELAVTKKNDRKNGKKMASTVPWLILKNPNIMLLQCSPTRVETCT